MNPLNQLTEEGGERERARDTKKKRERERKRERNRRTQTERKLAHLLPCRELTWTKIDDPL